MYTVCALKLIEDIKMKLLGKLSAERIVVGDFVAVKGEPIEVTGVVESDFGVILNFKSVSVECAYCTKFNVYNQFG